MHFRPQPVKAVLVMRARSQKGLAQQIGVSQTYVGWVVNGRVRPSRRVANLIAAALGEPVEVLFRAQDLEPQPRHPGDPAISGRAS